MSFAFALRAEPERARRALPASGRHQTAPTAVTLPEGAPCACGGGCPRCTTKLEGNNSGVGDVTFTYTPEEGDQSSRILFIQVARFALDGKPVKPSSVHEDLKFLNADTTGKNRFVDHFEGEKDPYYNGDDPKDHGQQGDATSDPKKDATMKDQPDFPVSAFGTHKVLTVDFRTAAFSAAGADAGTYYEFIDWTYTQKKDDVMARTKLGGTKRGDPGAEFRDAVEQWASKHGFKLPRKKKPGRRR